MKYLRRIKPVEAVQWDESLATINAIGAILMSWSGHISNPDLCTQVRIEVRGGIRNLRVGDWIIRNTEGDFMVMGDDEFKRDFEEVK